MASPYGASRSHTLIGPTTLGRTPLDGWSARRRDLYLTTHNIHERQTSVPPVGFEPAILPTSQRPQTHALDRSATEICTLCDIPRAYIHNLFTFKDCNDQRRDVTLPVTIVLEFQRWTSLEVTRLLDIASRKKTMFVATAISISHFHPHLLSLHVLFSSFHSGSDFFLRLQQPSDQIYCILLLVHSCHPSVSSSASSSRGAIKLNPITGSECNTGSGGSSVGAVTRLWEPGFDSRQGSDIFLCGSRLAVVPT